MEFREVVARRRMVRAYRPDPVDPEVVRRILDRARRAPSAGFSQGQHFVVVTDKARRAAIAALCREPEFVARGHTPWLSRAPVHVLPCVRPADYETRYARADKAAPQRPSQWTVPFWWVDGGAALMLLLLAAADEGLGAGFLDIHDAAGVRALLGIPADVAPLGLVTLGHPDPSAHLPLRRHPGYHYGSPGPPETISALLAPGRRMSFEVPSWARETTTIVDSGARAAMA